MRSSRFACLVGLAAALAAALAGCDALTPPTCVRNSDCPTSQICGGSGQCALAPDGGVGDASGDAGASAIDAAAADAPAAQAVRP